MKRLEPPKNFKASRYTVEWDEREDEFVAFDRVTNVPYAVTPHALGVLQDEEFRMACFAVQEYLRRTSN